MTEINTDEGVILEALNAKVDVDMHNGNPDQAFKEMVIDWSMPDYATTVQEVLPYTALYDCEGIVYSTGSSNEGVSIQVDGVTVYLRDIGAPSHVTSTFRIPKGSIVTKSGSGINYNFKVSKLKGIV